MSLLWPNGKTSLPVIAFNPKVVRKTVWECKKIGGIFLVLVDNNLNLANFKIQTKNRTISSGL